MAPKTFKQRSLWTLGNLLMFAGVYVFLYVGGLYATDAFYRAAARGDSSFELPLEAAVESIASDDPQALVGSGAPAFTPTPAEVAKNTVPAPDDSQVAKRDQVALQSDQPPVVAAVTRIQIPSIDVDSKVIDVGWTVEEDKTIWQVAKFAVGHHKGTGLPGQGENIVMAGHVGGAGPVFARLIEVQAGDQVVLFAGDQQFVYTVQEVLRVQEVGVSPEQRMQNASYMDPQGSEMVTLITCWPAAGPHAFDQRIIVRAVPLDADTEQPATSLR